MSDCLLTAATVLFERRYRSMGLTSNSVAEAGNQRSVQGYNAICLQIAVLLNPVAQTMPWPYLLNRERQKEIRCVESKNIAFRKLRRQKKSLC